MSGRSGRSLACWNQNEPLPSIAPDTWVGYDFTGNLHGVRCNVSFDVIPQFNGYAISGIFLQQIPAGSYCNTDGGGVGEGADAATEVVALGGSTGPETLATSFSTVYYSVDPKYGSYASYGVDRVCTQQPIGHPQYYNCLWWVAECRPPR